MANSLVIYTPENGYTKLTAGATAYGTVIAWNGTAWATLPPAGFSSASTIAAFVSDADGYRQVVFQNKNSGSSAAAALVIANDLCDNADYYADFGMTSSTYANYYDAFWELPNSVFFTANGSQSPSNPVTNFNFGVARGLGSTNLFYNQGINAYVFNTVGALSPRSAFTGGVLTTNFGTAGQVLASAGPGAPPQWVDQTGGGGGGSGTVTSITLTTTGTGLTVSTGLTTKTITSSGTFTLGGTLGLGYGGTGSTTAAGARTNLGLGTMAVETASDYLKASDALSTYLTQSNAASTYLTISNASSTYLTQSSASSTYLTQSSASSTYYAQTNPAGYITSSALAPYLSTSNASSTYLTISNASSTYLTQSNASSTYLTQSNASSTYLTQSSASSTYLTQTNAGLTYAPLASPAFTGAPTAPTPATSSSSTAVATTAFVKAQNYLSGVVGVSLGGTGLDLSGITDGELLIGQSTGSLAKYAMSVDAVMDKEGKVKVTGIQNTPVAATSPVTGQVLQFDGTNYTPGIIPNGGSGGGGITYYFDYGTTTGISPTTGLPQTPVATSLLGRSHVANATPLTSANLVNGTPSLVCGFVTAVTDPSVTDVPAGLWDFNIWASAPNSGSANQTSMQARVYRYRSSDSTYLELGRSDLVYLYDLDTRAQYILSVTMAQATILATDRIYIEIWAQKAVSNPRTVMLYFQADSPSHVHTTLPSVAGTGIAHVVDGVFQSPAAPISLDSSDTSGQLPVAKGGTGQFTLTNHALLIGQGTGAVASLLGTATGQIVYWDGTDWTKPALSTVAVTSLSSTHMTVSNSGVGAVTLTLPQAIATTSSPSFAGLTLTGLTGYLKGNGASVVSASSTIPVADVTGAAPLASPTFTGTPLSTTAAVDNDTTQIATTAYVVGQGYLKSATASSIYAPLASPTFTGIVTIPAGASIAGYLTTATAASTYAPLASPTFTGTVTIPSGASISGFAPLASPTFTGTPLSTTAAADTNTTQIATTAYVVGQASSSAPVMDGSATIGTSLKYARANHVHPSDTSRAPLASPTFTGTVTIPAGASISGFATLASPTFTGTPSLPTGTTGVTQIAGNNTTALATTAFVTTAVAAASGAPYDFGTYIPGSPVASTTLASWSQVRAFTVSGTSGNQYIYADFPPTTTTVTITLYKLPSGSVTPVKLFDVFWTANQAAGANGKRRGSLTAIGDLAARTIAAGDVIYFATGATVDSGLTNISVGIYGNL